MGLFEFVFSLLVIVPVAVVMFIIFRKLTEEYNVAIRKERDMNSGKHKREQEFARYSQMPDYRRDNPPYDAYRRRMEEKNKKEREW